MNAFDAAKLQEQQNKCLAHIPIFGVSTIPIRLRILPDKKGFGIVGDKITGGYSSDAHFDMDDFRGWPMVAGLYMSSDFTQRCPCVCFLTWYFRN
jgi:hypothetical protein